MRRKGSPRCASAAAWASRCASSGKEPELTADGGTISAARILSTGVQQGGTHGPRGSRHGWYARYRRGHLENPQGRRLLGRGELRRQRRGGAEIQGRNRHRGLQMGRVVLR